MLSNSPVRSEKHDPGMLSLDPKPSQSPCEVPSSTTSYDISSLPLPLLNTLALSLSTSPRHLTRIEVPPAPTLAHYPAALGVRPGCCHSSSLLPSTS